MVQLIRYVMVMVVGRALISSPPLCEFSTSPYGKKRWATDDVLQTRVAKSNVRWQRTGVR